LTVGCAGNGSYGGVAIWLAQHVPSGQLVAIKSLDFDKCELPYTLVQVRAWNFGHLSLVSSEWSSTLVAVMVVTSFRWAVIPSWLLHAFHSHFFGSRF